MKNLLNFKKLKTFFMLFAALQVVIVVYFVYYIIDDKLTSSNNIEEVRDLIVISKFENELVHGLQFERGQAVDYVKSNGTSSDNKYLSQKEITAKNIEVLLSKYKELNLDEYDERVGKSIKENIKSLDNLKELYSKISSFNINAPDVRESYSKVIKEFISHMLLLRELSTFEKELYDNVIDLYNLMNIGQTWTDTRAVYNTIFTEGLMDFENLKNANSIKERRELYWEIYISAGTVEATEYYNNRMKGPDIDRTLALIKKADENFGQPLDVDAKVWFNSVSNYIAAINDVEEFVNKRTITVAEKYTDQYNKELIFYIVISLVGIGLTLAGSFMLTNSIVNSVNQSKEAIVKLSEGDLNIKIETERKDEIGELLNAVKITIEKINAVNTQTNLIISNINDGKTHFRAELAGFAGNWKDMIIGLNNLVDSFTNPFDLTAEKINSLTNGIIPEPITEDYKGDFNIIKNNLNSLIDVQTRISNFANDISLGNLDTTLDPRNDKDVLILAINRVSSTIQSVVAEINNISSDLAVGKLNSRMDVSTFSGSYKTVLSSINSAVDILGTFFNLNSDFMIADANREVTFVNTPLNIQFKEIESELSKLFGGFSADKLIGTSIDRFHKNPSHNNNILQNLRSTHKATISLGVYRFELIVNPVFDINNKISSYIVNWKNITGQVNFNENLGALSKNLNDGQLVYRIDVNNILPEFKELSSSINSMVDSIVNPLNVASTYLERISNGDIPQEIDTIYNGDFEIIKNNLNKLISTMNLLVSNLDAINVEHDKGFINYRINDALFAGVFRELMVGLNSLVNSHIDTKKRTINVFNEFAGGNFAADIEKLPNDKKFINDAIDSVRQNFINFNKEITDLAVAAQNGELGFRANSGAFKGGWNKMVSDLNELMDKIVNPINDAGGILEHLSQGDLTVRIEKNYGGEFEKLKNNINFLAESLEQVLSKVSESVQSTAATAHQLTSAAETMAASAQEQSAQTDDVATAVEEMSRTITENASSSTRTAEVAEQNGQIAVSGGKAVEDTVNKMKDIALVVKNTSTSIEKLGASSQAIGEIISVIDDIADQTNLLALNAAIEAARAGEQGRGFAVVADEVRKLAERTSDATKEIAKMIKGIQQETQDAVMVMQTGTQEVENGIKLADDAGNSLRLIVSSSQELINMISQISAASEEQSATSEEISKNVNSISKVISDSARQIEEIADSSENLSKQTVLLTELMQQFKLSNANQSRNSNRRQSNSTNHYLSN